MCGSESTYDNCMGKISTPRAVSGVLNGFRCVDYSIDTRKHSTDLQDSPLAPKYCPFS